MKGLPININNVSGNGVVNVGGAISISPLSVSKTVYGSGGSNTGIVIEYNFISQTKAINSQFSDQNVTKTL
ncbi:MULTISPECIES: spore germination protein [Bacillus subtilis group]|uniref:spore germination protein n=1 Tax=Bacillus subtilis group TaxID=653685 RepID=UPI00077AFCEC|nr:MULTISPECIES: spore germination protein [Bacillus subtilis group]KXZ18331.1 spore gernimation protein [Bacillus atrophaeus]MCY8839326.1 spore germination protein [Bacillus atrophaeus]MCY8933973.1 spore germination protein [Bacillus atrophaeus]MCY8943284.1 spore germination protein [Bacillus atrophaeus]MCY8946709.1 spore germination protein [Bacillus atrophaeus]